MRLKLVLLLDACALQQGGNTPFEAATVDQLIQCVDRCLFINQMVSHTLLRPLAGGVDRGAALHAGPAPSDF